MTRKPRTLAHGNGEPPDPQWPRAEFIAAALAILCYINAPPNHFCDDGIPIVRDNQKINEPDQWLAIWTTDYWSETKEATPNRDLLYRPVALTSYRLVAQLAGREAFPQLLCNVALHALISALVVRLCRRVKGSEAAALVAGILFAVLPIHTEVIDNVVGRADMLAALGLILALLWHRRSTLATRGRGIVKWRIAAGTAAFVAMGSKENGISVLPMIVLLDALWYRPWRAASRDRTWWNVRSLLRFTYLIVPAAAYFGLRFYALEGHLFQKPALTKTVNVLVDAPLWQHVLGVVQLWGMYWEITIWPRILCVNYSVNEIRLATSVFDPDVVVGLLIAVALAAASVAAWQHGARRVAYLSAAIVICYLPTSNAFVLIQVFLAERIWYVPSIWIAILGGLAAAPLVHRPLWAIAIAIPLFIMTERCWLRNGEWTHNSSLYAAAYRDHPEAIGALRLHGQSLVGNQGKYEEGIELLKKAIEIDLGFTDAHRSLGDAYLKSGNYPAALSHLQIADMQVPGHPPTVKGLKLVRRLLAASHEPELIALTETAQRSPYEVDAEIALVQKLRSFGHLGAALDRLQAADDRFANSVAWQAEYAVTLVYLNDRDQAIDRYRKCLNLGRDNPQLMVELAMLLLERREGNDVDDAWQLATRAAKLAPKAVSVLVCRAELIALRGDLAAAGTLYQEAIHALPADSNQRRILEARARVLGQ